MIDERWKVLASRRMVDHPYVRVDVQSVELPGGRVIEDWPMVHTRDYANALVINEAGQAMILEGYKHGLGRSSWQVVGGYLEKNEDPLDAIKRELLEETGWASDAWLHLGSFVVDANRGGGVGHFFMAKNAKAVAQPSHQDLEEFSLRWIDLDALEEALANGRVGILSYAVNIALGLLNLRT